MEKIIDGVLYASQTVPNAWDVRVWEKDGHREISARNATIWEEVGPAPAYMLMPNDSWDAWINDPDIDEEERNRRIAEREAEEQEARDKNRRKAAERAKTMCRRVIKTEGFNELLTLTYRENQPDRELCKRHFKEWVRRMKRALGGHFQHVDDDGVITTKFKAGDFRYCASFERQERGSMHVHIATHKLPKHATIKGVKIAAWQVGTRIWRSIVGADNGMCFVGGKTRWGAGTRRNMSVAKMAAYVSKYILKDYADAPEESNRYSRSNGTVIPKPVHMRFTGLDIREVLELAFQCSDAEVVVSHSINAARGSYWLVTEPLKPGGGHAYH